MPYISVSLPPGLFAAGTKYQSKGFYRDSDLMRWEAGAMGPIGGWRVRSDDPMDGIARCALTWADNSAQSWLGNGTHTHLYAMTRSGSVDDITPAGFVAGRQNSVIGGGYGSGDYGLGLYGVALPDSTNTLPASVWTLDTFGENLVGVMDSDQVIYEWVPGDPQALAVANAPDAAAILTTAENILMALACDGNPRLAKWSAIQDNTDWTPTVTNQARDQLVQTQGALMCGKRVAGGNLILTDEGAFRATYVGPPFVYQFDRVGSGCGIVGRQAIAVTQTDAYWMGREGFFVYNGFVQPLACAIQDLIFSDFNQLQSAKVSSVLIADHNEVWWLYPSADSIEVNRAAVFNYAEGTWARHFMDRTCGTGANGAFQYPILIGGGVAYDHEVGNFKDGRQPFALSGPVEIGSGDNVIMLKRFIPDERNAGQVVVSFKGRPWPNAPMTEFGPYPSTSPADLRATARQMEICYTGEADADFRIGDFRFEVQPGGKR
jgi:hypothetical protein